MTLRHFRIFITVAEEKTMHAAARKLFISQPSVSQSIAELESHYQVQLFERLGRRLCITDAGIALLPYSRHALAAFDELEAQMYLQGNMRRIRIGASVSVGTCMLNDVVDALKEYCHDTEVYVTVNNTSVIEKMLLDNELDVGLVEGVIESSDLICIPVRRDDLIVASSPEHPFAQKEQITIQMLANQDFIARESGSNDRNQFEQFLKDHSITVNKKWVCSNTQTIKNAVMNGNGITIMSRMLLQEELDRGELVEIKVKDVHIFRDMKLVRHKNKYLSADLHTLIEICERLWDNDA